MPPLPHPAPGAGLGAPALRAVLCLALAAASRVAATPAAPPSPWREALRFDYTGASDEFARLHAATPGDDRLALAHASALLARQPRTQANILEARATLEKLAAKDAGAAAADLDLAIGARLLLGRIAEDHLQPPRPAEAREHYETLLREHAGHPLADQAAVHLALLAAYPGENAPRPAAAEVQRRIDVLRELVRSPEVRRDLHSLQGRLLLEAGDPRAALPHFVAARSVGYRQPERNAEGDLSIANLARETGDTALAAAHYREFLRLRPRDTRATTVARLLAELETPAASPARP